MTAKLPKGLDLSAENLIECFIKREGGTEVPFGFHGAKQTVYKFQPIDSEDPDSPHVCNVADEAHYQRFVNIPESYRPYDHSAEYEPVIAVVAPSGSDNFDASNNMFDILSVNPDDVSNDWLMAYAGEVLKAKQKQKLADMATTQYGLEFDYNTSTTTDIIRMILVKRIEEERNGDNLT